MTDQKNVLDVESERTWVAYDDQGVIMHVHRVITHRGAEEISDERAHARVLELTGEFGQRADGLRVIRADGFDRAIHRRVDAATGQLLDESTESTS